MNRVPSSEERASHKDGADSLCHSDHSLLRQWRDGSQDAARALYERYGPRLRRLVENRLSSQLADRLDAEDLLQSIFRRFFVKARDGDYDVPKGEELWGLFLVMALNRIRSEETFQRASKRDVRRTTQSELLTYACQATLPHSESTSHFLHLTIEEVLEELPERYRALVELRVEGFEVGDIAKRVGRSKRTVERCLQDVRRRLAAYWDG